MSYENDEWWDEDDPEWYEDDDLEWDDLDYYEYEPEPRPLSLLERIAQWFGRTRIGRAWHVHVDRPIVDIDDIPF